MKSTCSAFFLACAVLVFFAWIPLTLAQGEGVPVPPPVPQQPGPPQQQPQNPQPAPQQQPGRAEGGWFGIENPTNASDSVAIICGIAGAVRSYALPFAVFVIIIIGLRLVFAAASGNESQLVQAKRWLVYAFIGAAIIAAAVVLVNAAILFISPGGVSSCF